LRTGHASITSRLTRMNLLVSGTALVLACVAFLAYDLYAFQDAMVRNLSTEAQIIGSNSISAITFNDPQSARTTLGALKAAPGIISAGILLPDGRIFAEYSRNHEETLHVSRIPPGKIEAHIFSANDVVLCHSIIFEGQNLGVVYLRSDLSRIQQRFLRYVAISFIVLLLALLTALLISVRYRRTVSAPIIHLAETARNIAQSENYALRVETDSEYREIATLDAGFNEMLSQIQRRDSDLLNARQQLEQRVEERTRQLAATNRELESFAYSVSHDLRNPLDVLTNYTYLMQTQNDSQLDEKGREYLHQMERATRRMADLIEDLLNLSRMTMAPMHRESVDLTGIAHSISAELMRQDSQRDVDFHIEDSLQANGDSRLLRIVFENLIRNAWKYTAVRSRANIEIGSKKEGRATVYYVRDDGAGFDSRQANRLFQPFQRLHSTAEFPGTGIGLATVQRIVHRHGGEIWADGAIDKGATFYFTLQSWEEAGTHADRSVA